MYADKSVIGIAQRVVYVLNADESQFFDSIQAGAYIAWVYTETCVDLSVDPINVPAAFRKLGKITSFSISGNVLTVVANNSFSDGDVVAIAGLSVGTYLNGQSVTVGNSTPTQFQAAFTHTDVTSTSDSGTATQMQATLYPKKVTFGTSRGNWHW